MHALERCSRESAPDGRNSPIDRCPSIKSWVASQLMAAVQVEPILSQDLAGTPKILSGN